jgi:hypothetical protein
VFADAGAVRLLGAGLLDCDVYLFLSWLKSGTDIPTYFVSGLFIAIFHCYISYYSKGRQCLDLGVVVKI